MSDEIKNKLFEPLFSTKGFGVGLGMVIVKNIVDQHHGILRVESEELAGSKFVVRLPVNLSV
jgi:signal transduction histidine kinase